MSWLTTPSNRATQLQLFNISSVTESLSLVGNSALLINNAYHARIRSAPFSLVKRILVLLTYVAQVSSIPRLDGRCNATEAALCII
jgi:hypothetical protein